MTLPKDTLLSCTAALDPEKHRQPNVSMKIDVAKVSMEEKNVVSAQLDYHPENREI